MFPAYLLALTAWLAWIFVQYRLGDRPTNYGWFVIMISLGSFEYGKGIFAMFSNQFTPALAATLAILTTSVVVTYQIWRSAARSDREATAMEAATPG